MKLIEGITNEPHQIHHLVIGDGSIVDLTLKYLPAIQRWSFGINHTNLTFHTRILGNHINILRQWKNILPFGLACTSYDSIDPFDINDFSNNRVEMHLLSSDEIDDVEVLIKTQTGLYEV